MSQAEWRNGLCSNCCGAENCGSCMAAWFCTPCFYGRIDERLSQFPRDDKPDFLNGACCLFYLVHVVGFSGILTCVKRGEVRKRFGIQGNGCTDCLAGCCCLPCTLGQIETEVKDRATVARQDASSAYSQPQGGMVYQAPQQQQPAMAYQQGPPQQAYQQGPPQQAYDQQGYPPGYGK